MMLVDFAFARTTGESVGHRRTRHRHGSGPSSPGFKSRASDHFCIRNRRFHWSPGVSGTEPYQFPAEQRNRDGVTASFVANVRSRDWQSFGQAVSQAGGLTGQDREAISTGRSCPGGRITVVLMKEAFWILRRCQGRRSRTPPRGPGDRRKRFQVNERR